MQEEIQISVELPTALKLKLDIYCKINNKTQKETVIEALEKHVPEYYIKLQEEN